MYEELSFVGGCQLVAIGWVEAGSAVGDKPRGQGRILNELRRLLNFVFSALDSSIA